MLWVARQGGAQAYDIEMLHGVINDWFLKERARLLTEIRAGA